MEYQSRESSCSTVKCISSHDLLINTVNELCPAYSITAQSDEQHKRFTVSPFTNYYSVVMPTQHYWHTFYSEFLAMENNYGYSTAKEQQIDVWQRGSVNFKHRCATRNPVVYPQPETRLLATGGNPLVSYQDSDLCMTSKPGHSSLWHAKCPCNPCVKRRSLCLWNTKTSRWVTLRKDLQ